MTIRVEGVHAVDASDEAISAAAMLGTGLVVAGAYLASRNERRSTA
jgi:hypothetical protein